MSEYEDAAAIQDEAWPVRAAVADGATESMYARTWAETVVGGLCSTPATPDALAAALPDWQATWASSLPDRTEEVPWYAAAKARKGAFATLLGLEVLSNGGWRAVGIGDSVLFHMRGSTLQRAWPCADPDAFSDRPPLLPSRPNRTHTVLDLCQSADGTWQTGDAFLLATDAVAAWLLRTDPTPAQNWNAEAFREAAGTARAEGRLRNDDSTLLVLELRPCSEAVERPEGAGSS